MKKKLLPVTHPILDSYSKVGHILSIIQSHPQTEAWLYCNFIQLVYKHYALVKYDTVNWYCPWIHDQKLSRNLVGRACGGHIDHFLKDCIDMGYYIRLDMDHYHLGVSDHYMKKSRVHDIFVYGYDLEINVFYVADNFKGGIYSSEKISTDQIRSGFERYVSKHRPDYDDIKLMSFNEHADYRFDKDFVVGVLKDYVESSSTTRLRSIANEPPDGTAYGLGVYDCLNTYYSSLLGGDARIDVRGAHAIHKHKVLMLKRLEYMSTGNILQADENLFERFAAVERLCELHKNILLKYEITGKIRLLYEVMELVKEISGTERAAMEQLITALSKE